jgi:hypothetical protein
MHPARISSAMLAWSAILALHLPGQTGTATPPELTAFTRLSPSEQERRLTELATALDAVTSPYLSALRTIGAATHLGGDERQARFAAKEGKKIQPHDEAADTRMPQFVQYVFGVGSIDLLDAGSPSGKKATTAVDEHLTAEQKRTLRIVQMHQALLGMPPDADRVLAALLRQLDNDTSGDRFAAFLHAWKNGKESFYEALDRTSGTKDSVFFYDVMLGDFRSAFTGHGDQGSDVLRSLQGAHDALHDAFLAYRQYRGFREAVAYSLVLAPSVPLPQRLSRYEEKVAGGYSLREQVEMVLALQDGDPQKVTAAIVAGAPALPNPLWSAAYDPYPKWSEYFAAQLPKMIEAGGSSDEFLHKAQSGRTAVRDFVAEQARQALGTATRPKARGQN